jgi:hypothetical protein
MAKFYERPDPLSFTKSNDFKELDALFFDSRAADTDNIPRTIDLRQEQGTLLLIGTPTSLKVTLQTRRFGAEALSGLVLGVLFNTTKPGLSVKKLIKKNLFPKLAAMQVVAYEPGSNFAVHHLPARADWVPGPASSTVMGTDLLNLIGAQRLTD